MPAKITPEECKNLCKDCTTCCDYATIKIPPPQTKDDIDEIRWLLLHKITIFTEYNKCWYIKIYNKCIASGQNGLCTIYSTRPEICRNYSHNACERYKDREYVKETNIFNTEAEFLEFVNKNPKLRKINA